MSTFTRTFKINNFCGFKPVNGYPEISRGKWIQSNDTAHLKNPLEIRQFAGFQGGS